MRQDKSERQKEKVGLWEQEEQGKKQMKEMEVGEFVGRGRKERRKNIRKRKGENGGKQ